MKVLLVEDNRINRVVARDLLEKDGHRVDEAHNGEQGVEKAASNTYDLVLMDISMPVMDGIEATRAIRRAEHAGTHLPIVALTANAIPSERERFVAAGLADILVKPITLSGLRQILRQYATSRRVSENEEMEETDALDAVVNHGHLEELAATLSTEKVDRLIRAFLSEAAAAVHTIAQKLDAGETGDDLKEIVHHSAGSAALLGAEALRSAFVRWEDAIAEGNELGGDEPRKLLSIWLKTVPELRLHLDGEES
jgi:CheY-like chemotaxis protein